MNRAFAIFAYALVALAATTDPAGTAVMFIGTTPGDTG
jgi:hypothetical protein